MNRDIKTAAVLTFLALVISVAGRAQNGTFTPVRNVAEFKKIFSTESKKVNSITSSFQQEKVLSLLEEKMISDGKFWFKRNDKIRIEYQKPFQYLLILNQDEIIIKDHDNENRVNVRSNKLFQQINRIILDCVQGSILDNGDFSVSVFENSKAYQLVLTPVAKGLTDFFSEIEVEVDKTDFTANQLILRETGGDYTIIHFTNKELNANVSDAVFSLAQ